MLLLCGECGKRTATIHFTKIINGVKIDMKLCQVCANKKSEYSLKQEAFSFQQLLSGLLNINNSLQTDDEDLLEDVRDMRCKNCGLAYSKFSKTGRFGCAECYNAFNESLTALFRRIHGHTSHRGKVPKNIREVLDARRELERLKEQLANYVQREEFEEAARLRDKIKSLQSRKKN
ncbi:MAG: hypothetical protein RLZ12_429 [Bacillota bacterium]|jgi:protein arginine kinase activator